MALTTDYGEGGGHRGAHEEVIAWGLGEGGARARGWQDAVEEGQVLDMSARHGQQDLLGDWMWGQREIKGEPRYWSVPLAGPACPVPAEGILEQG